MFTAERAGLISHSKIGFQNQPGFIANIMTIMKILQLFLGKMIFWGARGVLRVLLRVFKASGDVLEAPQGARVSSGRPSRGPRVILGGASGVLGGPQESLEELTGDHDGANTHISNVFLMIFNELQKHLKVS